MSEDFQLNHFKSVAFLCICLHIAIYHLSTIASVSVSLLKAKNRTKLNSLINSIQKLTYHDINCIEFEKGNSSKGVSFRRLKRSP